jgi:predicted PhzF superfamily epimerase YddE/YHI9
MALELVVVDAFTDRRFAGNPAAVAFLDAFPSESEMASVAAEMNLAETAFCISRGDGEYDLRWFTPTVEVDLCGHATLATASLLEGDAVFHTRSGALFCRRRQDGRIELDFPGDPPHEIGRRSDAPFPDICWSGEGRGFLLFELADAATVRSYVPDIGRVAALGKSVIITAAGDRTGIDCVSRMFAPNSGIPEDPVTGSAHCLLALFWSERLGRQTLVGEQASRRGGLVRMEVRGERVLLSGDAVVVSHVTFV